MVLLKTLNFFLDASSGHSGPDTGDSSVAEPAVPGFPSERLSSSAWEGWWHDAGQEFPASP
ncbi:hypothetical protein AB0N65_14350 [Paenarthrobacter sp. NPDC089322]|uniref:hypothetical protein n=1 Tax=Paenarthrobacter sp. NPDC089322 TaxID=3155065 RepID=UPI00342911C4